uniref:Putative secreted protein n=1 Tax=Anopheles triannulatus TaxID=58253 RepID=A0A2M4B3P4_9DIPT
MRYFLLFTVLLNPIFSNVYISLTIQKCFSFWHVKPSPWSGSSVAACLFCRASGRSYSTSAKSAFAGLSISEPHRSHLTFVLLRELSSNRSL